MKKIYILLFSSAVCFTSLKAQLVLTKTLFEPLVGDVQTQKYYDSLGAVPKGTGQNLIWDFSAVPQSTASTFNLAFLGNTVTPTSSLYTGCNILQDDGSRYIYFKTTITPTTQAEILGFYFYSGNNTGFSYTFTNSIIAFMWPVSYGDIKTDTYAANIQGTFNVAGTTYTILGNQTGTQTMTASGTGTIVLPSGMQFDNVLQVMRRTTAIQAVTSPSFAVSSTTINSVDYDYYQGSQKFPLMSISYNTTIPSGTASPTKSFEMKKNNSSSLGAGLANQNFDSMFSISPNPAKDNFDVELSNPNNEKCLLEIYNSIGQIVLKINLEAKILIKEKVNISTLPKGFYFVKTQLGNKLSVRKLVVE